MMFDWVSKCRGRAEDLEWVGGGGCNGEGMEERRNGGGGMESMVCYQTVRYGER